MKDSELKKTVITNIQEVTDSELDAKILTNVYRAMDEARSPAVAGGRLTIWRIMMKSKITQFAAAAAVMILVVAGLMYFQSTSNGTGVVLADVMKKMEPIRTIQHRETWTITKVGEKKPMLKPNIYKYCSVDKGIVIHVCHPNGAMLLKIYFQKQEKKATILLLQSKQYAQFSLSEKVLQRLNELSPKGLISWFQEGQYKKLEQREIEGVTAEGFEVTDPPMLKEMMEISTIMFPIRESVMRVWVDVKTSMPVAAEGVILTNRGVLTGFQNLKIEAYSYDLQWNTEIDPDIFKLEIPDDYTPLELEPEENTEAKIKQAMGIESK